MTLPDFGYVDGNALAGPLGEMFAVDVTSASGVCAHCGYSGPVATLRVWQHAPGLVARCWSCDEVLLRLVRGPDRAWLNMQGVMRLEMEIKP